LPPDFELVAKVAVCPALLFDPPPEGAVGLAKAGLGGRAVGAVVAELANVANDVERGD
jgi:hypothetical protein